MGEPQATVHDLYFNRALGNIDRALLDVKLEQGDADTLAGKLAVVAEALLYPATSRYAGVQQSKAADAADHLFTALEQNAVPPEHLEAATLFMGRFASYRPLPGMQERALKLMKLNIDNAPDAAARDMAEYRFVAAFRDVADHYEYHHLRAQGLDATVMRFAAHMPRQMRLAHQADMLRHLGYASERQAYHLGSFDPFASVLTVLAAMPGLTGETKAIMDPLVEQTALKLAKVTRRALDGRAMNQESPDVLSFLSALNFNLKTGYTLNNFDRDFMDGARMNYSMTAKAMLYSMVLDSNTCHSNWFDVSKHPAVATLNQRDADPVTRHAMWRLRHPFQALFVPRRRPRHLKVDGQALSNEALARDIDAYLQDGEPLAPQVQKHFRGRRSRFAAPLPRG